MTFGESSKQARGKRQYNSVRNSYSKQHYPHLAACLDNLITLAQEVHDEFHTWNGGFQKPCTADLLIKFVSELYPENYEVNMKLNQIKRILNVASSNQI